MKGLLIAVLAAATAAPATAPADPPIAVVAPPVADVSPTVHVRVIPADVKTPAQIAAEKYRTEIVCRTTIATGSLIAKRKTCLTGKQWEYVDQEHRDEARKLMMDNMGRPPGS